MDDFDTPDIHLSIFDSTPLFLFGDESDPNVLSLDRLEDYQSRGLSHPIVLLANALIVKEGSAVYPIEIELNNDVKIALEMEQWPEVEVELPGTGSLGWSFHCHELFTTLLDALYTCWTVSGQKVFQRVIGSEFTESWFQQQCRKLPNFKFAASLPEVSDIEWDYPNTEVVCYPAIRKEIKPASREKIRSSVLYVNHYAGRRSVFHCKICGLEEHVSQNLDGLCRDCRPWFTLINTNYFHDELSSLLELKHLHYSAQPPVLELRQIDGRMRLVETEDVAKRRAEANRIPNWIRYLDEEELEAWEQTLFSSRNIRPFLLPPNPEWPLELNEDMLSNCRILTDKKQLYFYYADRYWDCHTPKVRWKDAASLEATSSLDTIYQLVETLWDQELITRVPEYSHDDGRVY